MIDVKQAKPTHAVGFAIGSPLPIPMFWIGDQTGLWINAPAPN
jgi:hypothetical protein